MSAHNDLLLEMYYAQHLWKFIQKSFYYSTRMFFTVSYKINLAICHHTCIINIIIESNNNINIIILSPAMIILHTLSNYACIITDVVESAQEKLG